MKVKVEREDAQSHSCEILQIILQSKLGADVIISPPGLIESLEGLGP